MDLGSLFLILALLILVGLFVARPLLERQQAFTLAHDSQEDHELSSLLAERDRILNALQELDFDHALGKIPSEDYPAQRAVLLQRGAGILRRLDELQAASAPGAPVEEAEARIEAVIAARRADAARTATGNGRGRGAVSAAIAPPDEQVEILLANRRRSRQSESAGFCPGCGGPLQKSDKFCPKCGHKL